MIKKYGLLCLIINITSVYAIFGGVGINIINDDFTIDEIQFTDNNPDIGTVTRSGIESPIGVGGFIYLTAIPFMDFEADANFTIATYDYSYDGDLSSSTSQSVPLGKFTWNLTAQRPIIKIPTMRLYLGAGVNGSSYTQLLTQETITTLDPTKLNNPDHLKEKLGVSTSGYHGELGMRFKPPVMPFSLNVKARYNFSEDFLVEEYMSVSIGMAFAI